VEYSQKGLYKMQARPSFLEVFDDGAPDVCFLLELKKL
jgi:hypothetical protein